MPDDGYAYDIDQCDVPKGRRDALQRYRDRRRLWMTWLDRDEHHAIWPTLHGMVWTDVAYKSLTELAGDDRNALNNVLIFEALNNGHFATQILAIRRLMDDTSKQNRISLRVLIKDLKRHVSLFTRENYVCYDGLPCDYQSVRDKRFIENSGQWRRGSKPYEGPQGDSASEGLHLIFDKLAGVDPARRRREDQLPKSLLTTIEQWLNNSGADGLADWSSTYLAHAGGRELRERIANKPEPASNAEREGDAWELRRIEHRTVTTDKIKVLARAAEAISLFVSGGGRSGSVMPNARSMMPGALVDQFAQLDQPIMRASDEQAARDRWDRLGAAWNRCVDGVEDELIGRPEVSPSSITR